MEEVKPIRMEKNDLEHRDMSKTIYIPAFLNYQDSNARIKTDDYSVEKSSSSIELPVEPLMEEFKPTARENDEIEYRKSNNNKNNCTFRHKRPITNSLLLVQGTKNSI